MKIEINEIAAREILDLLYSNQIGEGMINYLEKNLVDQREEKIGIIQNEFLNSSLFISYINFTQELNGGEHHSEILKKNFDAYACCSEYEIEDLSDIELNEISSWIIAQG